MAGVVETGGIVMARQVQTKNLYSIQLALRVGGSPVSIMARKEVFRTRLRQFVVEVSHRTDHFECVNMSVIVLCMFCVIT